MIERCYSFIFICIQLLIDTKYFVGFLLPRITYFYIFINYFLKNGLGHKLNNFSILIFPTKTNYFLPFILAQKKKIVKKTVTLK